MLFPSSSTRDVAFVPVFDTVHHSGTKSLNHVLDPTPSGDPALRRQDIIDSHCPSEGLHCDIPPRSPCSDTFTRCKGRPAPRGLCDGGERYRNAQYARVNAHHGGCILKAVYT